MTPAEAERAARVRLGSVASAHEEALSGRWEAGIESVLSERHGLGLGGRIRSIGGCGSEAPGAAFTSTHALGTDSLTFKN
jgi:hypothetical protein